MDRIVHMAEVDLDTRSDAVKTTSAAEAFAVRLGSVASLVIPILLVGLAVVMLLSGAGIWVSAVVAVTGPAFMGIAHIIEAVKGHRVSSDDE